MGSSSHRSTPRTSTGASAAPKAVKTSPRCCAPELAGGAGEVGLGVGNAERGVRRKRGDGGFPGGVAGAHGGQARGLLADEVGALALIAGEVEEELVTLQREILPRARPHRALVAELHAPEELALDRGLRPLEH